MKVALVHDWLTAKGGGELCVEQFLLMYPQADLFSLVDFLPEEQRGFLGGRTVRTSFIQRLPWAAKKYRSYLPLMPLAIEQFDLGEYDLIITTSSAVSKGVLTGPDQLHLSYTFSPIRYAWDLQHVYLKEAGLTRGLKSVIARLILHYIRIWDSRTPAGIDHFIAISEFIRRRIHKVYGRDSVVIYPPVAIDKFHPGGERGDYYVTASRMVPYKRIPMIVEAFAAMPDRKLIVIGDGPDMEAAKAAAGPNVQILGRQPDDVLLAHLQQAKAFIFAAEEDFGIAPLEAQACGTPVIAYGKGAALETIRGRDGEGQTGVFFYDQTCESLAAAVDHFETRQAEIRPEDCRTNAERFRTERFVAEIREYFDAAIAKANFNRR